MPQEGAGSPCVGLAQDLLLLQERPEEVGLGVGRTGCLEQQSAGQA